MSWPPFVDEVAFASLPFDNPQVYTALTARTRTRSWSRGRQNETVRPDTGRSTTVFETMDRALDPENTAGAYYPNVLPMRRIRCTVTVSGTTYYLFTHFIDPLQGWQINQDSAGYAEATVPANDGFDVLATAQFTDTDSFPQETVSDRITRILDLFSWPAAERDIDTSDSAQIQAAAVTSLTGQSALDQIQAAADTEDGLFFIDGRGYAVFHSRYYSLLNARAITSQATFCDKLNYTGVAGTFQYESLTPSSSPIVNDYLITRAGGVQQEALDSVSIGLYRRRSVTLDTLHLTDLDAINYGRYKVIATRDPHRRYDEMTLTPANDAALWLQVFQLQIGDRITVMWTPPGGGAADVRDMFIEAVSFNVGPGVEATVTYRLSPGKQVMGWVLGDALNSLLGTSTFLVY